MDIQSLLGDDADNLLGHESKGIPRDDLTLPGPDFVSEVWGDSDRSPQVLRNLQAMFEHGRLGGSGYVSILPVDQGIEHSAAASFAPNPRYFDPRGIVELAIEGGCNAVATTFGVLGSVSRKYAHRIPFIVKLNHNELLTYPNKFDQIMFGSVDQAFELGAAGVGATIYFGSDEATRQIQEVSAAFARAHELGLFTVLWCYLRNSEFKKDGVDYHTSADLTGQANHIGVTIEADVIKQKQPDVNGGYNAMGFGKTSKLVYDELTTDHPIDLTRWQVANCYMGRVSLINSGGESKGTSDLADAVRTAVINKRAGGTGSHQRAQGLPAPDERRRRAAARDPGRVPRPGGDRRLIVGRRYAAVPATHHSGGMQRAPRVARAQEAMRAARPVAPRDVVLGGARLPRIEHRLHDPPRPLDLVETQERRVVALEHVEQQALVGGGLAVVLGRVVGAQHRLARFELEPGLLGAHDQLGALARAHAEHQPVGLGVLERRVPEETRRRFPEPVRDLVALGGEALARAQQDRHAFPAPRVEVQAHRREGRRA